MKLRKGPTTPPNSEHRKRSSELPSARDTIALPGARESKKGNMGTFARTGGERGIAVLRDNARLREGDEQSWPEVMGAGKAFIAEVRQQCGSVMRCVLQDEFKCRQPYQIGLDLIG